MNTSHADARAAAIACAVNELLRLKKSDPTISGATLVLPDGEVLWLPAEATNDRRDPT